MNTEDGYLKEFADNTEMIEEVTKTGVNYIPVRRKLSIKEKADMQIKLYSPCACGSGKKFKFCCKS